MKIKELILRDYQFDAFKEFIYPTKGRCNIPTGGGKTPLEATILAAKLGNDINKIGLILAPRIVLIQQLMDEYRKTVFTQGIVIKSDNEDIIFNVKNSYRFIAFHSGEHEPDYSEKWFQAEDKEKLKSGSWKEISTTNINTLMEELDKAKQSNQIPIIFSTYHSCFKLSGINFNTTINDEAHYLAQENFHDNYKKITSENKYCFTATEKYTHSNNGRGLNNIDIYGKLLHKTLPAELIQKKYITGIKLHIEDFITSDRKATYVSEITAAIDKNIRLSSSLPQYKIIISTPGTAYIKIVEDNIDKFNKYNCPIFTISSKGKSKINNIIVKRSDFLKEINKCDNALIFHYDILSEGIDVDGITGVAINRNMATPKAIQTFGRAMRIHKANPELKPYAWVTVTCPNRDADIKDSFKNLIDKLLEEGYDPEELLGDISDTNEHEGDKDNIDDAYINVKKSSSNSLAEEIEHYVYDKKMMIAMESFENKDKDSFMDKLDAVSTYFKEMNV